MIKIGGSAIDYTIERQSARLYYVLNNLAKLQENYQLILTVGGGKRADITKMEYKLFGKLCDSVRDGFIAQFYEDLKTNMNLVSGLIGKDKVYCVYRDNTESIDKLLNNDKILLFSALPDDMNSEGLSAAYSDAHTIRIANIFKVKKLALLKRTDCIYIFDPYKGYDKGTDKWKQIQNNNKQFKVLSVDDFFKGNAISRIGAFDGDGNHLFDDLGLVYFKNSDIESIDVIHISPYELFIDGSHVVTKQPKPAIHETAYMQERIDKFLLNEYSGIIGRITK